jgi:hypothetical protein
MSSTQPNPEENVISLQNISRNFLTALQRQYDMLAFTLAGIRTADSKTYDYYSSVSRVMPAPGAHLNHEQMVAYARGLLLRTSINDLLALSAECMNQCYLLCTLIQLRGRNQNSQPDIDKIIGEKQEAFVRMKLQQKFNELEQSYSIVCDLEDGIFSIATALRVLARGGLVTNDDLSPDGALTLEFKSMQKPDEGDSVSSTVSPQGIKTKLVDTQRTFRPGEVLDLTDEELLSLNITVAKFLDGLFRSVDAFGREQLGNQS